MCVLQELQFATVAQSAALVVEDPTDGGSSGSQVLMKDVSSIGLIAAVLAAVFFSF